MSRLIDDKNDQMTEGHIAKNEVPVLFNNGIRMLLI